VIHTIKADIVIVGSGAGGAAVAKELSCLKKNIYIVEKGSRPKHLGSELFASRLYDKCALFNQSKEGVLIYRTVALGGTTLVSCGNGLRALENELSGRNIHLEKEFIESEKELGIIPNPFISKTSLKIKEVSKSLGINMIPMPKFINKFNCTLCGCCVLGCNAGSKWTALNYIAEAEANGAKVITEASVYRILKHGGKVTGISAVKKGRSFIIKSKLIILCAGALETPVILQNSGIKAGNSLFCDLLNVTYGISKDYSLLREPSMSVVTDINFFNKNNFILSPFLDSFLVLLTLFPSRDDFKKNRLKWLEERVKKETGPHKNFNINYTVRNLQRRNLVGIMTKIKDDNIGSIDKRGLISKTPTKRDLGRLEQGVLIAKNILSKMGIERKSINVTRIRGAHPGGTAAIGDVVDNNLQTDLKGLFVCDASVFPESSGLPPILTITALAKRLSKYILQEKF
jgi:choline dehydrogenase-like flavoprotein